MKRQIIKIDESKCDGCGLCIPECKEGAIQLIDGKARLISDLFCDGLGACLGHCPRNAITIEEREAVPYDEIKVLEIILKQPISVLKAHLAHLKEHKDILHYNQAIEFLNAKGIKIPSEDNEIDHHHKHQAGSQCPGSMIIDRREEMGHEHQQHHHVGSQCPGSMIIDRRDELIQESKCCESIQSELKQWPVQLHLVSPDAPYFKNAELVIMSTCGPIASAEIHQNYIKNRAIVVACPKLDYTEPYTEKLSEIFKRANTTKIIVVIMQVPCCKGLMKITLDAIKLSNRNDIILEEHILGLDGKLISTKTY